MTTVIPVISETFTIFHIRPKILDRCRGLDTKWPDDQVHREKHRGIVDLADLCRCSDTTGVIKPTWKQYLTNSMNRHFEVGHPSDKIHLGSRNSISACQVCKRQSLSFGKGCAYKFSSFKRKRHATTPGIAKHLLKVDKVFDLSETSWFYVAKL